MHKAHATNPARAIEAKPVLAPITPAGAQPTVLRSKFSTAFWMVPASLFGAGILLLALAALEPRFVQPMRLRRTFVDHRGDLATAGVLLLAGMGIAYLIALGSAT